MILTHFSPSLSWFRKIISKATLLPQIRFNVPHCSLCLAVLSVVFSVSAPCPKRLLNNDCRHIVFWPVLLSLLNEGSPQGRFVCGLLMDTVQLSSRRR